MAIERLGTHQNKGPVERRGDKPHSFPPNQSRARESLLSGSLRQIRDTRTSSYRINSPSCPPPDLHNFFISACSRNENRQSPDSFAASTSSALQPSSPMRSMVSIFRS